ncbi:Gfo/Idh/MocA family protein [Alkalihalobacillus sp. TS-13]|uniref:Gfo/Idh/MocA family protein n=1 Tax=Alkalihalobacillus sp. TS-13 TaxID=2842455 RepID=UPI001C88964A|nr:Gfo/Idh/MocA family oxidoreductase [Alkalihalobacillus sp. TS-13]
METIKVGIIGIGIIGKQHLEFYSKIPGAEVIAAADINGSELDRVAEKYNIAYKYTDFRKMLERDDLDAVDVCLHNNYHAPVTIEALQAGKHVYCEKPIAGSYLDGSDMLQMAQQYGKKLHIQLSNLYLRETKAAKVLIEEGKLGKIFHARSAGYRRRGRPFVDGFGTEFFTRKESAGGGALFDMGVYHISELLYLMDMPEVSTITGKIYQEMDMDPKRREISRFDTEEVATGYVRFKDGASLDILESWAIHLNEFDGSSIVGSKGGIRIRGVHNGKRTPLSYHTTMCDMDVDTVFPGDQSDYRWHQLRENTDAYDSSQHHWIAALQGRVNLLPTAQIALDTMLISEGIYLSDHLGREVTADEVRNLSKSSVVTV